MKRGTKAGPRAHTPEIGLVEWFRPGEYERVESVLEDLRALEVHQLRTGICWADWYSSEGDGWYAWLLPRLAQSVHILPCFIGTPPSLGIVPKFSSPPQTPNGRAKPSRGTRIIITASIARPKGRAPRWKRRAAARITAPSAPRTISATAFDAARSR